METCVDEEEGIILFIFYILYYIYYNIYNIIYKIKEIYTPQMILQNELMN